jgi:hypothetical protein
MLIFIKILKHYIFWRHINNATNKKNIFLNTTNSNYVEGTRINTQRTRFFDKTTRIIIHRTETASEFRL